MEHLRKPSASDKSLAPPLGRRDTVYNVSRNQYSEIPASAFVPENDDEPETNSLLEYWRILRRHAGTWVVAAFIGALAGFLVTLPQTPIYRAKSSVEIVGINENFLNFKEASPLAETSPASELIDIQTQAKILQSESLLDRVIAKLQADQKSQVDAEAHVPAWRKLLNLPDPDAGNPGLKALKKIARSLKVRVAGQTRILELTVDSPNPRLAADFANTLTSEFIEQNLESRWKTTERTSDWLSRQLDDERIKLERSEDVLQRYAREAGLVFTDEKTNVSEDKLKQLQQELSTAQADRISKQSRYEMAQSSPPDALPDVLNDPGLRDTQAKITDLRRQIADLSTTYTGEYSKVKRMEAELSALQEAFEANRAGIIARIRNEFEEAQRKEKLLTTAYEMQTKEVTGQGEKAIQYNILKREADSNRQLYETMLQQLKESTIASAIRASNVRVVDPAQVPKRPDKPDPPLSAGVGLFAGVLLGAAFIIMRERADRTIQQPGDASFYLNVPELGIILSGSLESSLRDSRLPAVKGLRKGAEVADDSKSEPNRVEQATRAVKPSMLAESFRSTLLSIVFAEEQGPPPKTFVLTSAGAGEGKSTLVSNLGIAIADVGHKVLLIDADLRRPRLHEIFGLTNERGLSSILREKIGLNGDVTLGGMIRQMDIPGLSVLTSGPGTSSATNLLYGPYMPELLRYLRDHFDIILIDTPPMLQIPDARVLGRMSDKVILVVRAGLTTRDAALAARQRFSEDGTSLLGTILNDWNPKNSPNGYYGNYGYYNYYNRSYHYYKNSDE
ncbi:MAG: polysaccharide biosynthesis tyrosine autokinase [Acidobacteriaceae bacterium]|nr:polysaccharide biosynthesis tyrosine autokinase [Acidobacteriaceae bacterium]